jgi:hypothetical protein
LTLEQYFTEAWRELMTTAGYIVGGAVILIAVAVAAGLLTSRKD